MSAFAEATAVRAAGGSSYAVSVDPAWSIAGVPNGGYLMALLIRAALDAAGVPDPLAVSAHFTRPPSFGPAEIQVERVKSGRQTSALRASLWQADSVRLDTLITAGTLPDHDAGVGWNDHPMPTIPPPEDCAPNDRGPFQVALLDMVEERLDPATVPFERTSDGGVTTAPGGEPVLRGWLRLADGTDPDPLFVALAVDAMPPTVFNLGHFGWAPTVELTVLLRGRPAPGWLLCESRTHYLAGGWFDEECTAWDSTGRVVAQSRQLALLGR